MLWVSELTVARWPPFADVLDSDVRHLAFIYIYIYIKAYRYLYSILAVFPRGINQVPIRLSMYLIYFLTSSADGSMEAKWKGKQKQFGLVRQGLCLHQPGTRDQACDPGPHADPSDLQGGESQNP